VPIPICRFARARRLRICKHSLDTAPDYGFCAAQNSHYFGYKLHGVCSLDGIFTDLDLSKASIHDIPREDDYGYTCESYGEAWPSWSPDGNKIVFESYRDSPFEANGTTIANANLYIVNSDGTGGDIRITNNLYYEGMPSWSPNGDKIAFIHTVDPVNNYTEGYHLYIMDINGSNWERITTSGYTMLYLKYSPDGTKIVYSDESIITIYNVNNQSNTSLEISGDYPSWSPDGTMIVYTSNDEIYVVDINGDLIKKINLTIGAR